MKISKLFHWLYAILMLLPFGLVLFNMLHGLFNPSEQMITFDTWVEYISEPLYYLDDGPLVLSISNAYRYLFEDVFGLWANTLCTDIIHPLLVYWTCISIIWLVFDVFMYLPLLVHKWIDKAKIE